MKCKNCGKSFVRTHCRQVYCGEECRRAGLQAMWKRQKDRQRALRPMIEMPPEEPRYCAICHERLVRRSAEQPSNWRKRRTCGATECVVALRLSADVRPGGPVDRQTLPAPLAALPANAFADDPRAKRDAYTTRMAGPDPQLSAIGSSAAWTAGAA